MIYLHFITYAALMCQENLYANENDTIYENENQIGTPAVTSQIHGIETDQIDLRYREQIARSTNLQTMETRLISRSTSSPDATNMSVYPETPSSGHDQIGDLFSATQRTCDETVHSIVWDSLNDGRSGAVGVETHTGEAGNSPTTPTNKSNKLDAIKRELKMLFPTSDNVGESGRTAKANFIVNGNTDLYSKFMTFSSINKSKLS